MQIPYIFVLMAFLVAYAPVKAETLTLDRIIQHALQSSPETARITLSLEDAKAEAFEVETLTNPTAEIDITAVENDANRSVEIELEQPVRLSHFDSRIAYAEAIRHTADIEQKAKLLGLVHSITLAYASYWAIQEQEKILTANVSYAKNKFDLIERGSRLGFIDRADADIFKANVLVLKERLRSLRIRKQNGAVNLLRMAGIKQRQFEAMPLNIDVIPDLDVLKRMSESEGSIRNILQSRRSRAEHRLQVAKQDVRFPEFAPRAIVERDFDDNSTAVLFGINIAIPIWDRNNAELSRARAERQLADRNLAALNRHNFSWVIEASYNRVKELQLSTSTYRDEILPAWRKVASLTDLKFESGQASVFELFQMRERISEIEIEALQANLNFIEAQLELESLVGQSLSGIKE